MNPLDATIKATMQVALIPARVTFASVGAARAVERQARREVGAAADRALMASIDAVLPVLFSDEIVDRVLTQLERSGAAQRVADRLLEDGIVEEVARRALAGPEVERVLADALDGPLVAEAVSRLLENQAVWVLVDEIARSPSVTAAIASQGTSFAEDVAVRARERSRNADALLERVARRLVGGRGAPPGGEVGPRPSLSEGAP
jgi:hypothetical protein